MDDKLVPFMVALLVLLLAWGVVSMVSFWRTRRALAWNVVHAAWTRRQLSAAQVEAVDAAGQELLAALRMNPQTFASAPAAVRFALDAMAMQKLGIAPSGTPRPFGVVHNPQLARSVAQHIRVVRFHVENQHGVRLTELDEPSSNP